MLIWWTTACCLVLAVSATLAVAEPSGTLHIGNAGEPETLDPHRYNLRLEESILTDLFLGLTTFNSRGQTIPGAAERWDVSDDGLTWTFHLDPKARWSDGMPVTAQDFVYSFRRLQNPQTAASLAYFMYPLANAEQVNAGRLPPSALGARALDQHTLQLRLHEPFPTLPERLLYPTGYPVPSHVIEQWGDRWVMPEHWVSNGPYILAGWQPQAHVKLTANRHFPTPGPIRTIYYHPLASAQSSYNRYRNNELHVIATFPSGELPWIREHLAMHLRQSPLLSISYLVFNTTKTPFDDPRVREALALAVDRNVLTRDVQRSDNIASSSFVPGLVEGYTSSPMPYGHLPMRRREERARALLQSAGFGQGNPLRTTLRHISGVESKRNSLAIASFWKRIGVDTRLHQTELKVHFADLRKGDFEVAQAGWFGENNAEHYLGLLASSTGYVNYGRYANAAFDALMADARSMADLHQRNRLLERAEALAIADYPVVPLYTSVVRRLVHPDIDGWHENVRDVHPSRYLRWRQ